MTTPSSPYFSSGPCRKYHTYNAGSYPKALLQRSRQDPDCRKLLSEIIKKTKKALQLPPDYEIMITQGSDTGAIETAFWNLLGHQGTSILAWSNFGYKWVNDLSEQLKLKNLTIFEHPNYRQMTYSDLIDFGQKIPPNDDLILVWNATTVGLCLPDLNWLSDDHQGLVIADGTSIVFAQDLPWTRLDAVSFSWQKVIGGEAGLGMLVLSPKALKRIQTYTPDWPIPILYNLKNPKKKFITSLITDNTTNTISFLLIDDYRQALEWWIKTFQNSKETRKSLQRKMNWIDRWLQSQDAKYLEHLIETPALRSPTAITLKTSLTSEQIDQLHQHFADQQIALDIKSHPYTQKGLRIWIGPTIEIEDLKILFDHLQKYIPTLEKKIE